tara:strand:+ start:3658 stop:4461 length:804 start_codon:yes stop_codon:yes gene_type:complete
MDNFYNTNNISSKGRGGDTTVRTVKGESSHVNAFEAYLIDNYNKAGEEIVSQIGSGTINPNTGMKEYSVLSAALGPVGAAATIFALPFMIGGGRQLALTGDTTFKGLWDYSFGKHGLGGLLGGRAAQQETERRAQEAVDLGMKGIKESAKSSFGPGGYFDKTQSLNMSQTIASHKNTHQTGQRMQAQVGMATSGQAGQIQSLQQNQLLQDALAKTTQLNKDKADLALNLRNQVNQLLSTYGTATGESYDDPTSLYEDLDLSMGGTGG